MKRMQGVTGAMILVACAAAHAQVQPRMADAVQPRSADAVRSRAADVPSRTADPIQPRVAPAVVQREATPVADTAVAAEARTWQWQRVGDTAVAGEGVAHGMRLANIRCAGVACRAFEDSAGGWVIRAEGGFPGAAGAALQVLLVNAATRQPQVPERARGVFSDGRFWDQVETWRLPAGTYGVFYNDRARDQVLASIVFDVARSPVAAASGDRRGTGGKQAADTAAGRRAAQEAALKLQRCLAMAASNPDVVCVRE
ncbi:hypothetical protein [Aerolutibacter ruishenii]|uniref:Uncharacterized protein n=1 Tax=Aerolutibacter ruishenii TaxID=686800 RepID=A0A562M340_9GAMM|nr:hypothetical protein [Lysobacter ruishenii]TWI14290.1 hypothetical protein IP93_00285 [Lysobacter ruishenii]